LGGKKRGSSLCPKGDLGHCKEGKSFGKKGEKKGWGGRIFQRKKKGHFPIEKERCKIWGLSQERSMERKG